jgi:hypothetical protein
MTTLTVHVPVAALVPLAVLLVAGGMSVASHLHWFLAGWLARDEAPR